MTTHTLYTGTAGTGCLAIHAKANPGRGGRWLVYFTRWGKNGKMLDQCAAWMPTLEAWDRTRWHPIGSRLVPPAVLAEVEAWLRGRPVGELETTTTTETDQ
jgi:hypothetical protein